MKRRDFFTSSLSAYSLVVLADQLPAQEPPPRISEQMRREFDKIAPPNPQARRWQAEPNMTLVDLETDLFIAGGGLAGVCAALAAARMGSKVVIVQDRSRLGGNSSSEVKMHVVGANSHKGRPGWREGGILEELRLDDAVGNPQRCWEMWDLLLYDKLVSEPNITLLLDSVLYAADTKDNLIRQVMVRSDKTEHLYRIKAKLFMDCTGDCRLGLESGAEMRSGREAKAEFGESLAPEKADEETLGSSILFTSRLYRKPMPFRPPAWARKVTKDTLRMRKINSWEYGYWWIEWGGNLSTIRDNERIRFELLSIAMGVWDYIKNSGDHPSSDYWALDWLGMIPGKRGSRRMVGDHMLTQQDLLQGDFRDAVCIGGWPMDDHPPGGFDRSDLPPAVQIRTPEVYNIPLRSLYSRNIGNLLMAGRNISATHVAFTSTRVMATCAVAGQAAGTIAAQCLEQGIQPRQLAKDSKRVFRLQQTLLRMDQSIKGARNEDPADVARAAKVKASSEVGEARAEKILTGVTRDIPGKTLKDPPLEVHHWAGKLEAGQPAWIELEWDKPMRIGEVQLVFDTGFQRELTLTSLDGANQTIVRAPQPETVKDYRVLAGGKEVAKVSGNYQRTNRHRFEPRETNRIRVEIAATNGIDEARVFEVRCYA